MASNLTSHLSHVDLSDIRDAVPTLDLFAIRPLRRAGFQIIRQDLGEAASPEPQANQHSNLETIQRAASAA